MSREHVEPAADPARVASGRGTRKRVAGTVALVAGVVALVLAAALPLAPVTVNEPTVTWPRDPSAPESTTLMLTTYQPFALDVRFSCRAARLAGAESEGDGLLLSTVAPTQGGAAGIGLLASSVGGRVVVDAAGTRLVDEEIPPGNCSYQVSGGADGLVATRDGQRLAAGPTGRVPEVEALITGLAAVPDGTRDDLSVRLAVDDRFSTSPTPLKLVLIVVLGVAVLAGLVAAGALDRAVPRGPTIRRRWRPAVTDVVVVVTLVAWVFLAPTTDDDGYYGAMAENVPLEGYVANYYQLYNQSFTPFTWVYVALSKWQALVGDSPVALRIPALVCGLLTWWVLRRFVSGCLSRSGAEEEPVAWLGRHRWVSRGTVGLVFLVWWLPQDMGVRPEVAVALCALGALLAVSLAIERHRVALAGLGVGIAALGFAAHPTGFVTLAPVLAAAPRLWSLIRVGSVAGTSARAACLLAPASVGALAGFADGSLRDFVLSQQIFLGIQDQESVYSEFVRYSFLLSQIAMGSYAKRVAVLLALLALVWFAVLYAAARTQRVAVPPRLSLAAWTLALSFVLLWFTPSKWTHHFGALAGTGPAFLGLFLVLAPALTFHVMRGRSVPVPVVAAVAGSAVLAMALAGHGPNDWAYAWMFGLPHASVSPYVWIFHFDQPAWWLLAVLLAAGAIALWCQRRAPDWRRYAAVVAVPVVVVGFVAINLVYLTGSFGLAAARTMESYSLGAANLQDPLATGCPTSRAVEVLDEQRATPLPPVPGLSPVEPSPTFAEGTGWSVGSQPPVPPGVGAASGVWGSLISREDTDRPEQNVGRWATPWYVLPPAGADGELAVLVTGRLGGGNELTVQYGAAGGGGARALWSHPLAEGADPAQPGDSTAWRGLVLPDDLRPPATDAVRLLVEDDTTDVGGWLAFTAPSLQPWVPLEEYVPEAAAVGLAWQFAFKFPCLRQPRQQDGVTEAVEYAVLWGEGPAGGFEDGTWQKGRGGAFARVPIVKSVYQPVSRFRDFPDTGWLEVYRFPSPLAADAYELSRSRTTLTGW